MGPCAREELRPESGVDVSETCDAPSGRVACSVSPSPPGVTRDVPTGLEGASEKESGSDGRKNMSTGRLTFVVLRSACPMSRRR